VVGASRLILAEPILAVEVAEPLEHWKSVLLPRLSENTPVRAARASTPGTKIDLSKPSLPYGERRAHGVAFNS
jgi:hypothetical protein